MDIFLIFFLNRSFLDIDEKIKNRIIKLEGSSRFCKLVSNGAQNFKFIGFIYATLID